MQIKTPDSMPASEKFNVMMSGNVDKSATYTACLLASISLKEIIPPHVLVNILRGYKPIGEWEPYIGIFFGECPAKIMHGVVEEHSFTMQDFEKCYQSLPQFYQTPHFREVSPHVFSK